jgi:hypothetical protein
MIHPPLVARSKMESEAAEDVFSARVCAREAVAVVSTRYNPV